MRQLLVQLVSLMRMRVPSMKRAIDHSLNNLVRAQMLVMDRANQLPQRPSGWEEALTIDNIKIVISNWKCLELMFASATDEHILDLLWSKRMTIHRHEGPGGFLTGDQPVSLYHLLADDQPFGIGLGTPGVEISLPLSRTMLLCLDDPSGPDQECLATDQQLREFNRRTMAWADEYVFSHESSNAIRDALAACCEVRVGYESAQYDHEKGIMLAHWFRAVGPA